jgi:hypothetical protein
MAAAAAVESTQDCDAKLEVEASTAYESSLTCCWIRHRWKTPTTTMRRTMKRMKMARLTVGHLAPLSKRTMNLTKNLSSMNLMRMRMTKSLKR